ncbi:hypothetical protein J7E93_17485 [Streptomyces sp. ISL-36]|uniref:hypothetical protein n=1 Tax=Streptomyces sp. ISL-36 TaxID=2819182 RepID=UPI001BE8D541|nr:hypothetical protein [Streptomyces sp. ISL-36]MBT2441872.1 hypothetical protein [Streptomyces sp. ISL-36]
MGGTDPTADNTVEADGTDDALYVLTAVLLTPAQYPSVLGDDYPAACAALELEPYAEGYGLVLGQDGAGARWTVIVDDVSLVAVAIASWDCGMEYDLSPDERSVVAALPGWPLAVASAAPGLPAPHDPEPEEGDRAPLAPPAGDGWGPAQRRLGADEVALQWAAWRAQMDESEADGADGGEGGEGGPGPEGSGPAEADGDGIGDRPHSPVDPTGPTGGNRPHSLSDPADPTGGDRPHDPYDGVRRALADLRGYLEEAPPVGRVRSSFAAGGARMLRADGPGWSLVARTDDMAFVLLDDEPREVLPVARGPKLPALLEALEAMAVRPS